MLVSSFFPLHLVCLLWSKLYEYCLDRFKGGLINSSKINSPPREDISMTKDTVKNNNANLDYLLVENTFVFIDPKIVRGPPSYALTFR